MSNGGRGILRRGLLFDLPSPAPRSANDNDQG